MADMSRRQVFEHMSRMRLALVAPPGHTGRLSDLRNSGHMQPKNLSGKNEVLFVQGADEIIWVLEEYASRYGYRLVKE